MDTDALIEALAREAAPVPRLALERRLSIGLLLGAIAGFLLLAGGLGFRPDLADAAGHAPFWEKGFYALSLGIAGVVLAAQLARPDSERLSWVWLVPLPVAIILPPTASELIGATGNRADLVIAPAWTCMPLVLLLAVPFFGGIVWALRRMAPTRLAAAGAAAGLAAGGLAATLYALHCEQLSPTYVLTRYTFAVGISAAAGAVLGPRLMRW